MSDIEIEIDGKAFKAQPNQMVIQVADEAGIYIPRFCYHKHLAVAANCRMCLVEVEKSPKALPACATPVMPGMKVFTRSPKALAAQKAVMEFLLINHPLDCPICDQGGECELQDLSMGFGSSHSNYKEGKRSVKDQDIGPLIATEMTRCIQCTRCVRFGDEIAGLRELGTIGRGEHMEIGTYVEHAIQSEVSGNIIDLCPVGALTSKPFRFKARAWELQQYPTIAPHDCIGSHMYAHTRNGRVMRMVPRENASLNETWLSDRDRFSYEGLAHPERLTMPLIRVGNTWQETDWQTALEVAVEGLQKVITTHGAETIGALTSPNSTVEELYLLQKLLREVGSPHIDHRLRQTDFADQDAMPVFPGLGASLSELENADVILLVGSNIQKEQPIAGLRVRKAFLKGATILAANMVDYRFNFGVSEKWIVAPHEFVDTLAKVAVSPHLVAGKRIHIVLGALAFNHPEAARIRQAVAEIAKNCHATISMLTEGGNTAGAWLAGAVPHREAAGRPVTQTGLSARAMFHAARQGYVLLNVEPELDCAEPVTAMRALERAEFVLSFSVFDHPAIRHVAHVILPVTPFTETSGTFINAAGEWQSFKGVALPVGESRPMWKVLRVLANLLQKEGFEYGSSEDVRDELKQQCESHSFTAKTLPNSSQKNPSFDDKRSSAAITLSRIGEIPLYETDNIVRRAKALQATQAIVEGELAAIRIHPDTAEKFRVKDKAVVMIKQQDQRMQLPVIFDTRVPLHAVLIAGGMAATSGLNELFGAVDLIVM